MVPFSQLDPGDRARLAPPGAPPDTLTLLRPNGDGGWRRMHAIGPDTTRFLEELRAGSIRQHPDPRALARLVLDGIIEIEVGGAWLSGPDAYPVFFSDARAQPSASRVQQLSLDALRYGAALPLRDPRRLALRLYRYNTRPASPEWRERIPKPDAVTRLLSGIKSGRGRRTRTGATGSGCWLTWNRADTDSLPPSLHKLYVSPDPRTVAEACHAVVALMEEGDGPLAVKVGRDLPSLLRPDKLVAYFDSEARMRRTAQALGRALAGMPAQGVPFTAPLDASGLLSWGVDSGAGGPLFGPLGVDSWRGWVTQRLAAALTTARASGSPVSPVRFALDRLALDGVDTEGWVPPGWLRGLEA